MLAPQRDKWVSQASCRGIDPDLFFPEDKVNISGSVRDTCWSCKVQTECLIYSLSSNERIGVWGGLSAKQRRPWRKWYLIVTNQEEEKDEYEAASNV